MAITEITPYQNVYIAGSYPNSNFYNSPNLFISRYTGTSDIYRTLMQFYVFIDTPDLPARSINSSKLQLTVYRNEIPSGSINASIYRLLNDLNDYTVTWNTQPPASSVPDGTASISSGFTGVVNVDITNLVRGWFNGSIPNNGILLKGDESNNSLVGFRGTKYPDSSTWPKLIINHVNGIQTVYPTQTIAVPETGNVYSTPIDLEGTKKEVTFLIKVPESSIIDAYAQISTDGINYAWANAATNNDWSFAVSIDNSASWARVLLTSRTGAASVEVTAITWEN